jgi:hypothetical protein
MINVTVQKYRKTATIKIVVPAAKKHKKGIRNANLVLIDSADHFVVNADKADKADISYYQLIVAAYLTMVREKNIPTDLPRDEYKPEALKIIENAARMRDIFRVTVSKN